MNNEISLQCEQLNLIQRKFLKELPWCLANVPVKKGSSFLYICFTKSQPTGLHRRAQDRFLL